jgi:hypothetical protein
VRFGRDPDEQQTGSPMVRLEQKVELGLYFVKFDAVRPHLVAKLAHESPELTRIYMHTAAANIFESTMKPRRNK